MVPKAIFGVLLGAFVPVLCSSPDVDQKVSTPAFNPRDYARYQKFANCPGVNRSNPSKPVNVELHLQYTYIPNPHATRTLLFVHGWPSLWSTWGQQILHFNESYNLLIPTLRGYGPSTHPGDVQTSGSIPDVIGDLACVMKAAHVYSATCVGHDWGAQVCWDAARSRPDIINSIAAVDLPYQDAAGNFTPVSALLPLLPHLGYQIYFANETNTAIKELNTDIRRSLRSVSRTVASPPPEAFLISTTDFLDAWGTEVIPPAPFLSQEEEDYMVEQYAIQGFEFTLEFYTTVNRNTAFNVPHAQGNFTIPQPALAIFPTGDPVANWTEASEILGSAVFIPNFTNATMDTAHWPQLEQPAIFNQILETWLNTLPARKH